MEQNPLSHSARNLKINDVIQSITSHIQASQLSSLNLGLLNGLAGKLLFLWQLSLYDESLVDEDGFAKKLEFLQENLNQVVGYAPFSAGLLGIGWLIEYMNQSQMGEYDVELCQEIDEILLQGLCAGEWRGEIEMVLGLGGYAIYAARRRELMTKSKFFDRILNFYEQSATSISGDMVSWSQPYESVYRLDKQNEFVQEYNLGLAHGVPGIIAALLPILDCEQLRDRAESLISKSCNWLLYQQQDFKKYGSYFSTLTSTNKLSRLGWCYGDLTIALTLCRSGVTLNRSCLTEKGIEIGLHSASRDPKSSIIKDAAICHGSVGLYLIFKKLYKVTGIVEFEFASSKWLDYTLSLFEDYGLTGLNKFISSGKLVENSGFLEGYAGIGLCLLSALSDEDEWTDCLLLS